MLNKIFKKCFLMMVLASLLFNVSTTLAGTAIAVGRENLSIYNAGIANVDESFVRLQNPKQELTLDTYTEPVAVSIIDKLISNNAAGNHKASNTYSKRLGKDEVMWIQNNKTGWMNCFVKKNGEMLNNCWAMIEGEDNVVAWHKFNEVGSMQIGFVADGGYVYYLVESAGVNHGRAFVGTIYCGNMRAKFNQDGALTNMEILETSSLPIK